MSSGAPCAAARTSASRSVASGRSPKPVRISRSCPRPSSWLSRRASMSPSLKKHAIAPAGMETVVWRRPVGMPQPTGGEEHAVTGSCAG